jgi:hypothetical protein
VHLISRTPKRPDRFAEGVFSGICTAGRAIPQRERGRTFPIRRPANPQGPGGEAKIFARNSLFLNKIWIVAKIFTRGAAPGTWLALILDRRHSPKGRKRKMFLPEVGSGSLVWFRLASVVCPDRQEILEKVTGQLQITGRVILLSDAGEQRGYFAIVEVPGIATPLVVPAASIETFSSAEDDVTEVARG